MNEIKQQLYQHCLEHVKKKQYTIEARMSSLQQSLNSETKSSVGDKHETGRAMVQLEMEKAGKQLLALQQEKELLAKISLQKSKTARLGSLINTSNGNYFLAISLGMVSIGSANYFVVSTASPIGKLLLGKEEGGLLSWNGKEIKVNQIS